MAARTRVLGEVPQKKTHVCVWVHLRNRVASTTPSHPHAQSLLHAEERSAIHHDDGRGPPRPRTIQERSSWCHTERPDKVVGGHSSVQGQPSNGVGHIQTVSGIARQGHHLQPQFQVSEDGEIPCHGGCLSRMVPCQPGTRQPERGLHT